jgi:hypothetical protein
MASEPYSGNAALAAVPTRRPKGPARPILQGVGLDGPFFADKNRAFWVLQSIGWLAGIQLTVQGRAVGRHWLGYRGETSGLRA